MQGKYRSHLEIQMVILETIAVTRLEPYLLTQLSYKTAMDVRSLKGYLADMEKKGFLTKHTITGFRVARNEYKITDNGRIILSQWLQLKNTWQTLVTKPVAKTPSSRT